MAVLTPRWTPLRAVEPQQLYLNSTHRFNVVPAGRRSGKTECAKRKLVIRALSLPGMPGASRFADPNYFCAAPTRDQAKRIYWNDMKALIPKKLIKSFSETELVIKTVIGSSISVVGMDKPERIEGSPWDGGILDEYGNMKASAWGANVRPALADRNGWCDLIGVPEGRNHYYDVAEFAKAQEKEFGAESEWAHHHWTSALILNPREIEAAKRDLDELTFKQEYEGSFINFTGRAYYAYGEENKAALKYEPGVPIGICFDFNVDPGIAAIVQEGMLANGMAGTKVIGEVWIPQNSNTQMVCRKVVELWGQHGGEVHIYGDATGGQRRTSATAGSDWDIVREILREKFGDKLRMRVPRANPTERARVNVTNKRIKNAAGEVRLMVDVSKAPNVSRDFDGVRLVEGGSGELDKSSDKRLTHLSDAIGYYCYHNFSGAQGFSISNVYSG